MARRKAVEAQPEGKVELTPQAAPEPSALEARIATLEATVSALIFSTFGARDSTGRMMARCACGCFATRSVGILHPVAGHKFESLCDDCRPRSALATEGVPQSETPLLEADDLAMAVRVNRSLNYARRSAEPLAVWGGS